MANFDRNTVYVLDSYGLIFRCYFAFISRPLTNQNGENVSALFGFFRNLHYVLEHYRPGYLVAAMDSKTKTFRHELYEQYKATRNKTPDDLHAQIPWIEDVLAALGVPVLQCDGYEADDIIATVAKKCAEAGRTCRILSGDKDLMQLVDETTQILKPESGAATWKVTGADGVQAEWGVSPRQLLDLLSLYGDSADNIPGVQGIGVKTAAKLLGEYGDLDGIYAQIEDLKGAVKQKLIDGKDSAYFSRKLVQLCDEVPCPDIDAAIFRDEYSFDYKAAAEKLLSYGVPAVAKAYAEAGVVAGRPLQEADSVKPDESPAEEKPLVQNKGDYAAITSAAELRAFVDGALEKRLVAFDCETDSLDTLRARIVGFSLCVEAGRAVYVPILGDASDLFSPQQGLSKDDAFLELARLFGSRTVTVVLHNGKFDYKVLRSNGMDAQSFCCTLADTMIAAWLLNSDRTGKYAYGLEYLAESVLGLKGIEFDELVEKGRTFADVELEKAVPYAAEDADFTFRLWQKYKDELETTGLYGLFAETEMRLLPVLAEMEIRGIHLDSQKLADYDKELSEGIAASERAVYAEVGHEFNIASPKQLQSVLFEERGLKPGKKTKTGYSTDTSVLEELAYADPVPRLILEYRELAKLQSTYVETLPKLADKNGRVHPDFVQTGTATGRLSCRDPNLQNIPVRSEAGRKIRSAFTAPPGKVLISADYSQIELVVLAHLSGDDNMCRSFTEGTDVHKATASLIFGVPAEQVTPEMRRTAKTINFGVIYGMSAFRLARDLGISRTQASTFIENYFSTYAKIRGFIQETVLSAEKNGFVETIFGRKRFILNINSRNKVEKSAAERIAVNTPVQGSAADIVKKAMLDVSAALAQGEAPARLLVQVHDELIFECPDDEAEITRTTALIREKMENAVSLKVPLRVSIEYGKNWGEFH